MLVDIPKTEKWRQHIGSRHEEAIGVGICDSNSILSNKSMLFLPDNVDLILLDDIDPSVASLRDIHGDETIQKNTWVERPDLFTEAASWFLETAKEIGCNYVICEAGYNRIGDAILRNRDHFIINGSPFYALKLNGSDVGGVSERLRQGRSRRFLGVETYIKDGEKFNPRRNRVFICDALDGDSLILNFFR